MTQQKTKTTVNALMTVGSGMYLFSHGRMIDFYSVLKKKNPALIVALTATAKALEQKVYLDAIVKVFLCGVKAADESEWQPRDIETKEPYYLKWIDTAAIAKELKVAPATARRELTKLHSAGLVLCFRKPNHIWWAAKDIPGFIPYSYANDDTRHLIKRARPAFS